MWLGTSAIGGALVGFGVRLGAPLALLTAAGDRLRGLPPFVVPDRGVVASTFVGVVQHVVIASLWAWLAARLARSVRGVARVGIAAGVALVSVSVDRVLPAALSISVGVATPPQRAMLATLLAAAVLIGMAIAKPDREREPVARALNSDT